MKNWIYWPHDSDISKHPEHVYQGRFPYAPSVKHDPWKLKYCTEPRFDLSLIKRLMG
jgi:hypothetical protein